MTHFKKPSLYKDVPYTATNSSTMSNGELKHTPWTQEQAEKWCIPDDHPRFLDITDIDGRMLYRAAYVDGFRFAISKAAEMIEACPTLYGETTIAQYGREVPTGNWTETRVDTYDTHSAKLVGVRHIEGSEK